MGKVHPLFDRFLDIWKKADDDQKGRFVACGETIVGLEHEHLAPSEIEVLRQRVEALEDFIYDSVVASEYGEDPACVVVDDELRRSTIEAVEARRGT